MLISGIVAAPLTAGLMLTAAANASANELRSVGHLQESSYNAQFQHSNNESGGDEGGERGKRALNQSGLLGESLNNIHKKATQIWDISKKTYPNDWGPIAWLKELRDGLGRGLGIG